MAKNLTKTNITPFNAAKPYTVSFAKDAYYSPSINAGYGPYESEDAAKEDIAKLFGEIEYVPDGLVTVIYDSNLTELTSYIWYSNSYHKLNGGSVDPGTGITVQTAYLAHIDNDNILVAANSLRFCTNSALVNASTTKVRLTYQTEDINIEGMQIITTIDDGIITEVDEEGNTIASITFVLDEGIKTDSFGQYIQYHFEFTDFNETDPDRLYRLPANQSIGYLASWNSYLTSFVQKFSVTEGDYTYLINCNPDFLSLPKNDLIPDINIDIDVYDYTNKAIIETPNTFNYNVRYVNKTGETKLILVEGDSQDTTSFTIGGNTNINGSTLLLYANANSDTFLFGEYIIITVWDANNVSLSKCLSILRESDMVSYLVSDYSVGVSNPVIKLTRSLLNTLENKIVKVNSTVYPEVIYLGRSKESWFSGVELISSELETSNIIVLVDNTGQEYVCNSQQEINEMFTEDIKIIKTYFKKVGSDFSINYSISFEGIDGNIITQQRTTSVDLNASDVGFWMVATPDLVAYKNQKPLVDLIAFTVYTYSGNDSVEIIDDLSKYNLTITRLEDSVVSASQNVGLYDEPTHLAATVDLRSYPGTVYNLYKNVGNKTILEDTCVVKLYEKLPEYKVFISAYPSSVIKNDLGEVTLTAELSIDNEIQSDEDGTRFSYNWVNSNNPSKHYSKTKSITVDQTDINKSADFICEIEL